jgi:hypothetical protein
MAAYPIVTFADLGDSVVVIFGAAVAAYGLAIILFFGIPTLAYLDCWLLVRVACLGSLAVAIAVASGGERLQALVGWSMVFLTALLCGWMTHRGIRPIVTYTVGLVVIFVLALIQFGPQWQEQMKAVTQWGSTYVKDLGTTMTLGGSSPASVTRYTETAQGLIDLVVRFLPATTILNPFLQFSVGFLWFSNVTVQGATGDSRVRPYSEWRAPFALAIPLVAALGMRLLGGDSATLIADNGLLVLALFYSVTGLALVENRMRKMGLPGSMRFASYLLLFLLQVAGFVMTALLGFIDSFVDWRGRAAAKNTVDN